jgi:hypothetical protein
MTEHEKVLSEKARHILAVAERNYTAKALAKLKRERIQWEGAKNDRGRKDRNN